jgi:hypothetical protein
VEALLAQLQPQRLKTAALHNFVVLGCDSFAIAIKKQQLKSKNST